MNTDTVEAVRQNKYVLEGQAAGAVGAIITLIVGVGVSVLVLIFVGSLSGQTYQLVEADINVIGVHPPVVQESVTLVNNSVVALAHHTIQPETFVLVNATSKATIAAGNYTLYDSTGELLYLITKPINAGLLPNSTTGLVNYTHGSQAIQGSIRDGITSGFTALKQTGNYLPIIVLAVVISLVLALVLSFTFAGGRMGNGSAL